MNLNSHLKEWRNCRRCSLHKTRESTCLFRGIDPPCDILFVGDAPSSADDSTGEVLTGDPGKVFDRLIERAEIEPLTWTVIHSVACYPSDRRGNYRSPTRQELMKCFPRVVEFIRICRPSLIVSMGEVAAGVLDWTEDLTIDGWKPRKTAITSPIFMSRTGGEDSVAFSYALVSLRGEGQFLKKVKGW